MLRLTLPFITILSSLLTIGQESNSKVIIDSLYREDQFYIGTTYNLLTKTPKGFSQSGLSGGLHLGFIRDMPVNKNRNLAIGLGFGLSFNTYNQNLFIGKKDASKSTYRILDDANTYSLNKFTSYSVELPLELRWRTSTPTKYSFWRIYTGFKLAYAFDHLARHKGDLGQIKYNNPDFEPLLYGLTLSLGYNTWNVHCYYALNPVFSKNAQLDGHELQMRVLKIGLIFYIL